MGLSRVYSSRPDLVLLDINMPQLDGWEVCRRIRDMSDIPVIMITIDGQKSDRLKGFGLGADDYVTKPFDFPELIARVGAVVRRSPATKQHDKPSTFQHGEMEIDSITRLTFGGQVTYITPCPIKLIGVSWHESQNVKSPE